MGARSDYWFGKIDFPVTVADVKKKLRPFYEAMGIEMHIYEEDYLYGWKSKESFNEALERGIEL